MFTLVHPAVIALLPLPIILRLMTTKSTGSSHSALAVPFFDKYERFEKELSQEVPQTNYLNQFILSLIWVLTLLACSRPIHIGPPIVHQKTGRNLMLAVDISGSMQIPDMVYERRRVRRIDLVKHVASQFILRREGDRIGLILFGSNAYLQSPLSFDRTTVGELLQDATVGLAGNRTAIGDAIGVAIKRLKDIPEKHRIVILLTDGANNAGLIAPIQAAKLAKDYSVKIYTIGLGAAQVSLSDVLGSPMISMGGSDLDENTLKEIAKLTGGKFFRANNSRDLTEIYQKIDKLEPIQHDKEIIRVKQDYYHWALFTALLLSFFLVARQVSWAQLIPLRLRARLPT